MEPKEIRELREFIQALDPSSDMDKANELIGTLVKWAHSAGVSCMANSLASSVKQLKLDFAEKANATG